MREAVVDDAAVVAGDDNSVLGIEYTGTLVATGMVAVEPVPAGLSELAGGTELAAGGEAVGG